MHVYTSQFTITHTPTKVHSHVFTAVALLHLETVDIHLTLGS
jgi:hypothetical protein